MMKSFKTFQYIFNRVQTHGRLREIEKLKIVINSTCQFSTIRPINIRRFHVQNQRDFRLIRFSENLIFYLKNFPFCTTDSEQTGHEAEIIDGKSIANQIQCEIKHQINDWMKAECCRAPQLTAVLVGDDPASHTYVNNKMKASRNCLRVLIDLFLLIPIFHNFLSK